VSAAGALKGFPLDLVGFPRDTIVTLSEIKRPNARCLRSRVDVPLGVIIYRADGINSRKQRGERRSLPEARRTTELRMRLTLYASSVR